MPATRGYFHFERSGSKLEITLSFFVCLQQHLLFLNPFFVFSCRKALSGHCVQLFILFRDGIPSLSSSYKIPGLVPACWLLFQCF